MGGSWNRDAKPVAGAPYLDATSVCLIGLTLGISLAVIPAASVRGEELQLAWEYATPQLLPMAVVADQADRPFLYVANDAGGLRILDMADRSKPREIGRYLNAALARKQQAYNNLVLHGDRAYIAVDYAGLEIVDISNPRNMRQIGWWNPWESQALTNLWFNSPGHTNQLVLDEKRKLLYLSAGDSELQVLDVSDQRQPRLVSHYGQPKNKLGVWGLTISHEYALLTYITAVVPFQSNWSGVKAIRLP